MVGEELRAKAPDAAVTNDNRPNIDLIEWGWGRFEEGVPAETFVPLTVWLSSGEEAWSGTLRLTYSQDRTQQTVIAVPVSTTPGRSTPVELTAVFPASCEGAVAELVDTRRRDRRTFSTFPSSLELPFPMASSSSNRILVVGESNARTLWERLTVDELEGNEEAVRAGQSPPAYNAAWRHGTPADAREAYVKQAVATNVRPERLPYAWAAYEGVALVILGQDAWGRMDPRGRSALQTWVWSGGRLLLEADGAGSVWANVFPSWAGETPIALNEQSRMTVPARLMDLPESVAALPPSQRPLEASSSPVLARRIELSARGKADGWRIAWPAGDDDSGGSGVLAVGPAGFGMVGVLSADPLRIAGGIESAQIRRLWREAMLEVVTAKDSQAEAWGWYGAASAPDMEMGSALTDAMNLTALGQALGSGVFFVLVGGVGVLAFLVGPGDWFILRKVRKSHLSWATALVWTGLASGFAYVAPSLVRSGGTEYGRVRVVDTLAIEPPVTASAVVSGVFGATSRSVRVVDEGPGTFTRGVSALQSWSDTARTFGPLAVVQRSSRYDPSLRESVVAELGLGQWTFRTLLTQTPARADPTAVSARLAGDPDEPEVLLLNVPVGATIHSGRLAWRGKQFELTFEPGEAGAGGVGDVEGQALTGTRRLETRRGVARPLVTPAPNLDGAVAGQSAPGYPYMTAQMNPVAPSLSMMGPMQRSQGMAQRNQADWALVVVRMSGAGLATPEESGIDYRERTYLRIAVPVPPGFADQETLDELPGTTP